MSAPVTLEHFEQEVRRLVEIFEKNLTHYKSPGYDEASLRQEFLNPLFRALGWDVENKAGRIPNHREVEIESRTEIGGRQKRADYLFRTDTKDRFICEAKKPAEVLDDRYAFQAKRYAWNKGLALAVLTDFEEIKIYVVGGRPYKDDVQVGLWKTWHYIQFPLGAREIWDLLSRDQVAGGSLDRLLESLPKKAQVKGRSKQLYLIKPDRTRALDTDFLNFLDTSRHGLAGDLYKHNDHTALLEDNRLNEATQRILDRLLFLRICEDRDIDTGVRLQSILETWQRNYDKETGKRPKQTYLLGEEPPKEYGSGIKAPKDSLWHHVVRHFRALDRRPPSHVPFFNGNLFKPHFSEDLLVSDEWLADFIRELSDDESPYLFNVIPVEILGTIYERFLGKVVRPHGRGVTIEEKPEVRKAGGVYYTPRYIVDYIVEQTVGVLVADKTPEQSLKLTILDPACGSGSFLIRAFERMCEHWQRWLTHNPEKRKKKWCWVETATGDVHLTVDLKRQILKQNIYGVDLDSAAVEVTQLSLYLKMLEGENRTTLKAEKELFGGEIALLPPLEENIKCFNSLIASDFSMMLDELHRVSAGDWPVKFQAIMKSGGFDAVIGNPPYRMLQPHNTEAQELAYLKANYVAAEFKIELFHLFLQRGISLLRKFGRHGYIVPTTLLNNVYAENLRRWIMDRCLIRNISVAKGRVFEDADVHTSVFIFQSQPDLKTRLQNEVLTTSSLCEEFAAAPSGFDRTRQSRFADLPGATWNILLNEVNAHLFQKLHTQCVPLEKIAKINRGLITGDRAKYFSESKISAKHQPILTGADVLRYAAIPPAEYVLFERPKTSGGCWDAEVHLAAHKIVIRQIGVAPTATVITEPFAVTGNIFTVRGETLKEEKYLLAVINSKLTAYFWKIMFADFKASFPQVTIFSLSQVPVQKIDPKSSLQISQQGTLVALVDRMLTLAPKLRAVTSDSEKATLQNALTATDQQIDRLVYELYGLTPEEIALVEGTA